MATAGEGAGATARATATTNASGYEDGGVGGKFRRRPLRRSQATPYDRPAAAALRNTSWLSKLVVDPASKLISAGAQRFFASILRKRLPPPPPLPQPPEERQESRNGLQETLPNQGGAQESASNEDGNLCNRELSEISELEKLFKQKAFTRSEIDRLTQLLQSRAVDLPVKDDDKRIEANLSIQSTLPKPISNGGRQEKFSIPLEGSEIRRVRAQGDISTPTNAKTLLEDEMASPAELAKAYMGTKSSKVSPSKLGLRSQIAREEAVLMNTSPFTSKSAITSMAVRTAGRVGIPDNGFTPPRSHGRSAIYNMAWTPYARVHSATDQKVSGSMSYGYTRPSSSLSQPAQDNDRQFGSRPAAVKRRSSVLDDDFVSVGPVRRIRRKANLVSHGSSLSARRMGLGSEVIELQRLPLMDEAKTNLSSTPSTSYAHVPSKSGEMAARILEHLERMTPKEKPSGSKLAAARETSPVKLTPNVFRGQALGSLEDLDTAKLLQKDQRDSKLGDQSVSSLPGSHHSAVQMLDKGEGNGFNKSAVPFDNLTTAVNTNVKVPVKGSTQSANATMPKVFAQPSERNRVFKISAYEGSFELENNVHSSEPALTFLLDEGRGRMEKSITESKSIPTKDPGLDSVVSVPAGATDAPLKVLESDKSYTNSCHLDGIITGNSGTVPSLSPSSTATVSGFSSGSSSNNLVSSNDPPASSASTLFSSTALAKSEDEDFTNRSNHMLSSCSATTISTSKSAASNSGQSVTNVAPSISSAPIFNFGSSVVPSIIASAGTTDLKVNAEKENSFGNSRDLSFPSTSPGSSTFGLGSFVSSSAASILSQGSLNGSVSAFSSKPSLPGSGTATVSQSMPAQFGSPSSGVVFGSSVSTSFTSSNTFGSASALTVSSSCSAQNSSLFAAETNLVSSSGGELGIDTSQSCQERKESFQAASSIFKFGAGALASSCESSVVTSSSIATLPATFGVGSALASSESNAVASSSGATSATFTFGVSSAPSSSDANAVTSTSRATPVTFNFGANSAPTSISGSSVTPIFSLGASSSALSPATSSSSTPIFSLGSSLSASSSATPSSSTPPMVSLGASSISSSANGFTSSSSSGAGIFRFGAGASASSSGANSVSSGGANSSPFGSTWQSPTSTTFGTMNTSPTGFSFGASSSSFGPTSSAPVVFGSTTGASSSPIFSFSSTSGATSSLSASSASLSVFGNPMSPFAASPGNNEQMNAEDSMAEDPIQSSTTAAPVFGQSPVSPSPPSFVFGSSVPSPSVPFQFNGQQNQSAPQNTSLFQASSSLEFNTGGGSFSLGSSGPDKSGRKFVKVNRSKHRKR